MQNLEIGNCWPKEKHLWLIQAALLKGEQALAAWDKWISAIDIQDLDAASYQILPKLYKNLKALNCSHSSMNLLEGVYRRTWAENQRMLYSFAQLAQQLQSKGIDRLVLLKGGALIVGHLHDAGIRPMGDIDFLVPKELAFKTIQQLIELGFKPVCYPLDLNLLKTKISLVHSMNFINEHAIDGKLCVDVHWSLLQDIPSKHFNSDWIDHAIPCRLHQLQISALSTHHLLYQVCIHGAKYSPVPLFRWIIDAVSLIQISNHHLDWNLIIQHARRDHLVLPIRDAFNYLNRHFDAEIPLEVLKELEKISVSWIQKLDFHGKQASSLLSAVSFWIYHSQMMRDRHLFARILTFPRYLKEIWELQYQWQLIYYIPFKIYRNLKKKIKHS